MAGATGSIVALWGGTPTGPDAESLTAALGTAAHGVVAVEDVRWEPSQGIGDDVVFGRWLVFLASQTVGAPRDLWRARVRVTPEGRPLSVVEAHNLTETPLGDEHSLVLRGPRAAFSTFAYGQEQSISLLDLSGEPPMPAINETFGERAMRWLSNVEQTGSGAGIGRIDVTLDQPAQAVGLALRADRLDIDLADGTGTRHASIEYSQGELQQPASGLHAEAARHLPKRFILWAVDTVRSLPWVGPAPIAWLEEKVFAAKDALRQLAYQLHGRDATETLADVPRAPARVGAVLPSKLDALDEQHGPVAWPPADIPSIWKTPEPDEGTWKAPRLPWMRRYPISDPSVPPAFLRTFVRPDEDRPYAQVLLVAMDMRQLDLDMEAGTEDPKPLTGAPGPGRIPRDPAVFTRVAAAFNGAFKTEHGTYGMMVHKRVLLPPQPNAASVVVLADSRVGFGTWGNTTEVSGIEGVADGDIVSLRQNLDPLIDRGQLNPVGRALWGYTLPGNGMQTERSALCVTGARALVYAWGDDVSATTLGKALRMAGCVYGMHLDMNPHHTGFIFSAINDLKGHNYHSELLSPLMEISPERYIEYSPKDFFYVMFHDPTPPPLGAVSWRPDGGVQPAPAWIPALWATRPDSSEGTSIELLDVEPGRAEWRIRAGTKEPDPKTGATPQTELSTDDAGRVLLSVGLGLSAERRPRGLATDGRLVLPVNPLQDDVPVGLLVANADGSLSILRQEELTSIAPHVDVAELPLLLDSGKLSPGRSRAGLPVERAALGLTPSARVIVARGKVSSDAPLGEALKLAGCSRAVLLDRGSDAPSFLDRTGTAAPPRAHYEQTTLYALAAPMRPRAFRFDARTPGAGDATRVTAVPPQHARAHDRSMP